MYVSGVDWRGRGGGPPRAPPSEGVTLRRKNKEML